MVQTYSQTFMQTSPSAAGGGGGGPIGPPRWADWSIVKGTQMTIDELLASARDENSAIRISAAQEIGRTQDLRAFEILLLLLADTRSDVREAATVAIQPIYYQLHNRAKKEIVRVLGTPHFSESMPLVLATLLDPYDVVAATAAESFAGLASPQTCAKLYEVITRDAVGKFSSGRLEAVTELLLKSADPSWIPLICRVLEYKSEVAKGLAIRAMSKLKDERFLALLADYLGDLENSGKINDNELVPTIIDTYTACAKQEAIPRLIELFRRIPSIRDALSVALFRLEGKDAAPMMLRHLSGAVTIRACFKNRFGLTSGTYA
jgi:hypothetical protein